jgi:hypothetical protein
MPVEKEEDRERRRWLVATTHYAYGACGAPVRPANQRHKGAPSAAWVSVAKGAFGSLGRIWGLLEPRQTFLSPLQTSDMSELARCLIVWAASVDTQVPLCLFA